VAQVSPRLFALAALLLVLAAPQAAAHVESFSQAKTVNAGPYTVYLQPRPDVVFANTTLSMTVQVYVTDTGSRARDVTASLVIGGPNEFSKRSDLRDDGTGYLVASVLLPYRGNYSARVLVKDANQTWNADTELEAYPDLPFRVRSGNAEQDVYVGEPASLTFEVVNRSTLRPHAAFGDMRVRMEHWNDEHTQMLGVEEATPASLGDGRFVLNHTFKARGMYHLKFASDAAGFTYADVPILHTYATAPIGGEEPAAGENNAPAPGLAPLLLAALAALVLARRRRA
jgi:LPXTG-motif cell wall-anchored protein